MAQLPASPGQKRSSQQRPARHSLFCPPPACPVSRSLQLTYLCSRSRLSPIWAQSPPLPRKIIQQATRPLATHIINVPSLSQVPSSIQHAVTSATSRQKSLDPYASLHLTPSEQNPQKGFMHRLLMPLFSFCLEPTLAAMCQPRLGHKAPDISVRRLPVCVWKSLDRLTFQTIGPSKADCLPRCDGPLPVR